MSSSFSLLLVLDFSVEIFLDGFLVLQGMRILEFMFVTNVGGPFPTHIPVLNTDELTRRIVERLKGLS